MSQITLEQFENLLNMSESSTLDFKQQMYDFENDQNGKKLGKFIKDIISFSNTIRTQSAYIVVGIEEKPDGTKGLVGLDKAIDESILQAKVKGKVFPHPDFKYYTYQYQNTTFGIFEFPIVKYETPIAPSVQLAGLQVGMVYYRNGSSNTEAIGHTLIKISDWLRGLKAPHTEKSNNEKMAQILKNAVNKDTVLSEVITEALIISKELELKELKEFCTNEIAGYKDLSNGAPFEQYKYRIYKTFFSVGKFEHVSGRITPRYITTYLKNNDNYYEYQLLYNFPITEIETYISHSVGDITYATQTSTIKKVLPEFQSEKDWEITFYLFHDSFKAVYSNIRQKLIELLIAV